MVTLGINTAGSTISICVIKNLRLLGESAWIGKRDESEKLLVNIERLLKKCRLKLSGLDCVAVVSGPGPFSSVRIGVTVAQILAHALGIPLYSTDTITVWRKRTAGLAGAAQKDAPPPSRRGSNGLADRLCRRIDAEASSLRLGLKEGLLYAGGRYVAHFKQTGKVKLLPIDSLTKPLVFFGDLPENKARKQIPESRLKSFGEVLAGMLQSELKKSHNGVVSPEYWQPPHITKPLRA